MAALAVLSELTIVLVVGAVTAATGRCNRGRHCLGRLTVTCKTVETGMRPVQWELRLQVVLEDPDQPVVWCVAERTIRAQTPLMSIVVAVAVNTTIRRIEKRMSFMASFAIRFFMTAEERESRQIVIESNVDREFQFAVATAAVCAELPVMWIVIRMASVTISGRQRNCGGLEMTASAAEIGMCIVKLESRVARVIKADIQPFGDLMAVAASLAVDTVVRIVSLVTTIAVRRKSLFELVAAMTGFAVETGVPAGQRETCPAQMIEERLRPVLLVVAALAFAAIVAHVGIVFAMASCALIRRALVLLFDVTIDAGEGLMRPLQLITRVRFVIEPHFGPVLRGMAVSAGFAEIAEMPIVISVTRNACRIGAAITRVRDMASRAFGVQVAADQREIGQVVIERLDIQTHDIFVPAFVIGVALGALSFSDLRREAMKASGAGNVLGNFLVTVETKLTLQRALKLNVAGSTFVLELGVGLHDRSGHDQSLEGPELSLGILADQSHGEEENVREETPDRHTTVLSGAPSTCARQEREAAR